MSMTSAADRRSHAVSPDETAVAFMRGSLSDRHASVSDGRALRGLRLGRARLSLRCFSRLSFLGHVGETREEEVPALGVACDRLLRESAMDETEKRSRPHRLEVDLDGAR